MISEPLVRLATQSDRSAITAMLAHAFADDPAMCFIFPDPAQRARRMVRLFGLLFDSDARAGMRLVTAGGEAAALWRGPGRVHTSRIEMWRQALPMVAAFGTALPRALALSEAIGVHMPEGAFWYLHIAGCDPAHQRKGFGGVAIRAGLSRAAGRLPAYLETATEANIGFYAAVGFRVTSEWRLPRGGPRFWSMLRDPD